MLLLSLHAESTKISYSSPQLKHFKSVQKPSTDRDSQVLPVSELLGLGHSMLMLREKDLQEEWGLILLSKEEIKGVKVFRGQTSCSYMQHEATVSFEAVQIQPTCVPQTPYFWP